ncbi:MAG: MFS transporter [Thermoplasmata archaeon]|jgi:MFS family permease|nr:MFS transporter [Thermoplasmata archaeon]
MAAGRERIRKYFLFRAVTSFSLWLPFWTIWANNHLESLFLLTVVDAAFWTTMIVLQVPTGLLGDKYGRKPVLFLGEVMVAAGVLSFGLSTEFWQFLGSNILWAAGICFVVSGDTPFLYDTLLELGRAKEFIGVQARAWAVSAIVNAIACITGGVLVEWVIPDRLDLTLIISALVALVGSFTILLLQEPKVQRTNFGSYRIQLRDGWNAVRNSRAILTIIAFQIVVEIGLYVMAVFRSVYMNTDLDLTYFYVGTFIGAFTIAGGLVATQAGKIEGYMREKKSLWFLLLSLIGSFAVVFLVKSAEAIVVQFLIYGVSYLVGPITNGYINKRVDSQHRSTVVSIATFLFTAVLAPVEMAFGFLATEWGTRESLLILALCIAPIGIFLLSIWGTEIDKERAQVKKIPTLKQL